jgi:hypothetical protein
MTTNFSGSATIYTFPARGRFAVGSHSEETQPAASVQLPRGVKIVAGSGWYHDEAIQAEQRSKN